MTTKKISGAGDFEHIQQRARRAGALIRTLTLAHNSDEQLDHDDYTEVMNLAVRELFDIEKVAHEAQEAIEGQRVPQ